MLVFQAESNESDESSLNFPMEGKVDVDEIYVGGQDQEALCRNEGRKKIVVWPLKRKGEMY